MATVFDPNKDVPDALGQITDAIAGFIQPYKKQEIMLREMMSKDPALAQKLSDLAHTSPGSIAGFAGPNAEAFFLGLDPSPETKARIAARPATDEALKDPDTLKYTASKEAIGATPGQVQQDKLTGTISSATDARIRSDPNFQAATEVKKGTGQSVDRYAQAQASANAMRYKPQVDALVATGQLIPEFQKMLNGEPSLFTGEMLDAAFQSDYNKVLMVPYIEAQKNARANDLIRSRFALGDKTFGESLDKYVVQAALKIKSSSNRNATVGDIIKMMGGSQDLVDQYGSSTPEGMVEAQKAFDDNATLKDDDLRANATINNLIRTFSSDNTTDDQKQVILDQINRAATNLRVPTQYYLDKKGEFVDLRGAGTAMIPTQAGPTRNQETIPVPVTKQKSTVTTIGRSTSASGSTSNKPVFVASDRVKAIKAKGLTSEQYKASKVFQSLTPEEQKFILSGK